MSDLKITHAGTVQTQDRQGPINPEAPLGQAGSAYIATGDPVNPPLNQVFVAITIIEDASTFTRLIAEDPAKYANTAEAAHNLTDTNATSVEGELGQAIGTSDEFPAGLTLYGRWTEIQLGGDSTVIAYIG